MGGPGAVGPLPSSILRTAAVIVKTHVGADPDMQQPLYNVAVGGPQLQHRLTAVLQLHKGGQDVAQAASLYPRSRTAKGNQKGTAGPAERSASQYTQQVHFRGVKGLLARPAGAAPRSAAHPPQAIHNVLRTFLMSAK
jgi:hypothetical protein